MAAAEESVPVEAPKSAPASGGGNKITLILTGVNLVATIGVIAVLFISHSKEKNVPRVEDINTNASHEETAKGGEGGGEHGGEHGGEAGAKKEAENPNAGKMITLEQFTVNLATVGSARPRFARVNISVEVQSQDTESEINRKMPQVRNTVIDLFNSKRPSDLATPEGRNYLKEEIKNSLNSFLVSGKVKGVFFTGFALSS